MPDHETVIVSIPEVTRAALGYARRENRSERVQYGWSAIRLNAEGVCRVGRGPLCWFVWDGRSGVHTDLCFLYLNRELSRG